MYSHLFQAACLSFFAAVLASPCVGWWATKLGIVDAPNTDRKFHQGSPPLVGGAVVYFSLAMACGWFALLGLISLVQLAPLFAAMLVLTSVGLLDDRFELSSRGKLAGQCLALAFLFAGGFRFHGLSFLGMPIDLGILETPIIAILLLGIINAYNFLDGADGFLATIGTVTSATLCVLAIVSGQFLEAFVAGSLTGALLGFLAFNFPPARMFLGDSGSMLVGLLLGCLILRVGGPSNTATPIGVAVAFLALPVADMCAAIIRRKLTGRSLASADRGHLHHCLSRNGLGPRQIVVAAATLTLIPAVVCIYGMATGFHLASWLGVATLAIILIHRRLFGHNELALFANRVIGCKPIRDQQRSVSLQESRENVEIWHAFSAFASNNNLSRVTIHLSGSWTDDGLDVFWESREPLARPNNWQAKLPIFSGERHFGHVEIAGNVTGDENDQIIESMRELVDSKLTCIDRLLSIAADVDASVDNEVKIREDMHKTLVHPARAPAAPPPIVPSPQLADAFEQV